MADPSSSSTGTDEDGPDGPARPTDGASEDASEHSDRPEQSATAETSDADLEALRQQVEEKYDFDNFGPADMAEMSLDEWEAVFDADSWVTGVELLERVEKDLKNQIARRDVFAVVERLEDDGEPRLVAYSDEGFAVVYPDGSVDGRGTVLRDVKPTVALCSMEDYEVEEPPENVSLPSPDDVPEGTGQLGNNMLQLVAVGQIIAGLGLFLAWVPPIQLITTIVAPIIAGVFVLIGLFLFVTVANARLSDRFRAEEYRNRLRAVSLEEGEKPDFLKLVEEGSATTRDDREQGVEGS
ncbi:hypothetical protein SAMN04487949_0994 [Halogranum gelatinilyticum]|uniref:DUF7319 domain-containing protein n=1 Tax=Halogranum gelatinilyticum TaxID=660521 RepID=A0A1G9QRP1_9EURY|nr:hypothetical protein [Halogranum gelatinilyticum]SDM13692.1 hypothetical protein SAMN04487949_0994 [Halogranum gelatinilyticum]